MVTEIETTIDIERCYRAMENIYVSGIPRKSLIGEALRQINERPETCMMTEYLGIKNYEGFGDQREDHQYGRCPRHGSIVFEIGRTQKARKNKVVLGDDELYFLECCRDFGVKELGEQGEWPRCGRKAINLCGVLEELNRAIGRVTELRDAIVDVKVIIHQKGDSE